MTYYDTFVGRLRNSQFDWSDDTQGLLAVDVNILTESFLDSATFRYVHERIGEKVPFRQLDWGSWAVPTTKAEILSVIKDWKIGWDLSDPGDAAHKPRHQRARCKATIEALSASEPYVFVIEEF